MLLLTNTTLKTKIKKHKRYGLYTCACGVQKWIRIYDVVNGLSRSCGCREGNRKHGDTTRFTRTSEYRSYTHMKDRCLNPNDKHYGYYGGRGIRICDRWLLSYRNFLTDMGRKPGAEYSLDRIDVNGNYEPNNCRWATPKQQSRNRRCCAKRYDSV